MKGRIYMIERMNITNETHDAFVKNHPNGDLLQLTQWAVSKELTGWYSRRVAIGRDNEVVGVAQILFKRIPKLPFTLAYVSRGFVCDYNDSEAVEKLLELTKEAAKRERSYAIKIDPDVEVENAEGIVPYLESLGFKHRGFGEGLSNNYIQPRMTMITRIDMDDAALLKSFERNNRSRVKLSMRKGTEVIKVGRSELNIFADLMKETGERDGFLTRDVSYFENIYDAMNPSGDAELFLVKLVPATVLNNIQQKYNELEKQKEKLQQKKDQKKAENQIKDINNQQQSLNKQIEELKELKERKPEGIYLSGALLLFSGHKSYYLYGASSNDYRDYLPNNHMQFEMMRFAREKGAKTYDFGGTNNEPDKDDPHFGLWQFKKVWGTYLSEKIGEFDYVLNPFIYQLAEQVQPRISKLKKSLTKGRK